MTPTEFEPPMVAALARYNLTKRMPKAAQLIEVFWNAFRGYNADPFTKALKSACDKSPDYFPNVNKVSAAMDMIAPPVAKKKVEEPEPQSSEELRRELREAAETLEKTGHHYLAAMARRRLARL